MAAHFYHTFRKPHLKHS